MSITRENFKSDLSKIVSKDELRPAFTVIYFNNGFAYATNAHALIKQSLEWMGFTKEEIEMLNGKSLDSTAFKFIRASKLIEICPTHISCFRNGTKFNVEYSIHSTTTKSPDYEAVIPKETPVEINQISFGKTNLTALLSAMHIELNPIFEFYGNSKATIVYDEQVGKSNQLAIIMPCATKY